MNKQTKLTIGNFVMKSVNVSLSLTANEVTPIPLYPNNLYMKGIIKQER